MGKDVITTDIPMAFKKRDGNNVIVLPNGSHVYPVPTAAFDNTMIKSIVRAFRWKKLLENRTYT